MEKQVFKTNTGLMITVELLDDYCEGEQRRYVVFIDPEPGSDCSLSSVTKRSEFIEVKLETTKVYDEAPEM